MVDERPDVEVDGETLGGVVRARREGLGMSLHEVAELAGCARSYLSCIENQRRDAPPSEDVLSRLEAALRLTPGRLLRLARWQSTHGSVKEEVARLNDQHRAAQRLLGALRAAAGANAGANVGPGTNPTSAGTLDDLHRSGELARLIARVDPHAARGLERAQSADGATAFDLQRVLPVEVPVINSVAAGYPAEFTDLGYPARVADEYVRSPDVRDPDAFGARVVGDSMAPLYLEGDIVIFSPAKVMGANGAGVDCFVRLEPDHESTFKRVFFEKDSAGCEVVRLQPLNPKYAARTVPRESVAGCYAAVSVTRSVG